MDQNSKSNWVLFEKQDQLFCRPFAAWVEYNELWFGFGFRFFWYELSYSNFR